MVADWEPELATVAAAPLGEWRASGRAIVVKEGPHRIVYRVDLPQRSIYLKHYRSGGLLRAMRHVVRPSASRREWQRAAALVERQIPTVRPLAIGERHRRGIVHDSYFISEAIEGTTALDDFWTSQIPRLSASESARLRSSIAKALGRFCAALHDAGIDHRDFHVGNVLIRLKTGHESWERDAVELFLIDLPSIKISSPLDWRRSRKSLTMLGAGLLGYTTQPERRRFFAAYCLARRTCPVPDARLVVAELESRCRQRARNVVRSRDGRPLRNNRDFYRSRNSRGRGHAVRDVAPEQLAALIHDPETLLRRYVAQPLKLSPSSVVLAAEMPTSSGLTRVAYKRYRPKNIWKRMQALFRPPRAIEAWRLGHALVSRGIATARPLAVVVPKGMRSQSSYLITEWIEGGLNLHLYGWQLAAGDPTTRRLRTRQAAQALGRLIGRLHDWHISHRDPKGCNLMIVERQATVEALLIDVDGVRVRRRHSTRIRVQNLARLAASMRLHPWITHTDKLRFLHTYLKATHVPPHEWKVVWRSIARDTEAILRRMDRRGEPVA